MSVKLPIDPSSPVPLFLQVKGLIMKEIISGKFDANKRLPTMRRVEIDNSLSRTTVERAYWLLTKEGYAIKKGNAYFIRTEDEVELEELIYN